MSTRPTGVSVVVPVLNGAATLFETLASIAAQADGRRPIEIIVVDDGSRDGSRAIVDDARPPHARFACWTARAAAPRRR